jgi:hypothetical protein
MRRFDFEPRRFGFYMRRFDFEPRRFGFYMHRFYFYMRRCQIKRIDCVLKLSMGIEIEPMIVLEALEDT